MTARPMDTFVGREGELARLERALDGVRRTGGGALLSIRGRRRVGKSRLVEELIQRSGSQSVFYTAVQGPGPQELERFLDTIARSDAPAGADVRAGASASSWEAALALAARGATTAAPVIIVIDALPYLVVLVGSDRATMEALTEEGRPLYDRAREMVVKPLAPSMIGEMLDLPPAEALDAYTIIGGFPVLALEWGRGRSREDYLADALTDPSSFLVISAEKVLAAELPIEAQARAVLSAIGADARAHKTILARAGLPQSSLDRAIDVLLGKGVIDRLTPYSAKPSPKNRQYVVSDPYLRFWLRFVASGIDTIDRGRGELILANVQQNWFAFRGRAIEPIVRDGIERLLPDERFGAARYVGGYWNRNNSIEVDLVGGDKHPAAERIDFIGSVKWRDEQPFDRHDGAALAAKLPSVPGASTSTKLLGVSRQGFKQPSGLDVEIGPKELIAAYGGPEARRQTAGRRLLAAPDMPAPDPRELRSELDALRARRA